MRRSPVRAERIAVLLLGCALGSATGCAPAWRSGERELEHASTAEVGPGVVQLHASEETRLLSNWHVIRVHVSQSDSSARLFVWPSFANGTQAHQSASDWRIIAIELPRDAEATVELRHNASSRAIHGVAADFDLKCGYPGPNNFVRWGGFGPLRAVRTALEPITELQVGEERVIYELSLTDQDLKAGEQAQPVAWLQLRARLEPMDAADPSPESARHQAVASFVPFVSFVVE